MKEPPEDDLKQLWSKCKEWINEHKPGCGESIYQVDSVNESLPDLAEVVCSIIGYYEEVKE